MMGTDEHQGEPHWLARTHGEVERGLDHCVMKNDEQ